MTERARTIQVIELSPTFGVHLIEDKPFMLTLVQLEDGKAVDMIDVHLKDLTLGMLYISGRLDYAQKLFDRLKEVPEKNPN